MGTKRAKRSALALAVLAGGCADTFAPHVPEEGELHGVTARARMEILTEHPTTVRVGVVLHNEGTTPAIYHYCTLRARVYLEGARRLSYDEVPYFGCTFGRGRITIAPGQRVRLRPRPVVQLPAFRVIERTYVVTAYFTSLHIGLYALRELELRAGRVTVGPDPEDG